MQNLILAGELGIEGRLVDEDYPTLYPTKAELIRLKNKFADGSDLAADQEKICKLDNLCHQNITAQHTITQQKNQGQNA